MLCRAVRDEAAADCLAVCRGEVLVASGWPAGCCPECGGEVWQSCAGAVQAVGKGAVRALVQAAVGASVAKSGKDAVHAWQGQLVQGAWEPASPRTAHPWFQD